MNFTFFEKKIDQGKNKEWQNDKWVNKKEIEIKKGIEI